MTGKSNRAFRRTARVAVGVAAASALTFAITAPGSSAAPGADAPFGPGTGTAIALVYKVNPIFGNLSFGITAGESIAGHQNSGATAQSNAINLGVIGVTLAGEGCKGAEPTLASKDQPQPVIASSDDPKAAAGLTGSLAGLPNVITMRAKANKNPFSQATTTVADVGDVSGVLLNGGTSTASSGVTKAGVRQARAVSDINQVDLFNGLVRLDGLHWEAIQQTGATTVNSGTFSLGAIHVAGVDIPLPNDALGQLAVLQDTLHALGFTIDAPRTRVDAGVVFVDPMRIGIVPSALRDGVVGGLLGVLAPVRDSFTQLLAQLGCDGDPNILGNNGKTAVTVLDLALAAISGAGELTVELGGVQATTAAIAGFEGLGVGGAVDPGSLTGGGGDLGDLGSGDLGALPDTGSGSAPAATGSGGTATKPVSDDHDDDDDGDRGGALAAIGGVGLALLLLTAEGDRRKMRQAQREIPLEA